MGEGPGELFSIEKDSVPVPKPQNISESWVELFISTDSPIPASLEFPQDISTS